MLAGHSNTRRGGVGICSVQPGDLVRSEGGLGAEWSGKEGQKSEEEELQPRPLDTE